MKKDSFMKGAIISTIGVILCKAIGLVYVIPFYAIIGVQGSALYSYAYSIYGIFLSLSNSGIPVAMSKVISEYNSLEYYNTKERTYKMGMRIIETLGFIFFIILILFAPSIARLILGDRIAEGGNSIESVSFVIRVVATALLIVPRLSVTKGYLTGHKIMAPSSVANVLEQLARVIIILVGSFLALKVFNTSLQTAVGISVFAATIGALVAYIYLVFKIRKNKNQLNLNEKITRKEAKITDKDIFKKIIFYALPFVLIDLLLSAYSLVDTLTVVRTLSKLGYASTVSDAAIGVVTTWGMKLNMIVTSIATGLIVSLIPNISSSFIKKNMIDVSRKINQALQLMLTVVLPMVVILSFLGQPVWIIFYGYNSVSVSMYKLFAFQALTYSFFSVLINLMQSLSNPKVALTTLLCTFLTKALINVPMMYLMEKIGMPAYYGQIFATLIAQGGAAIYLIRKIKKTYKVDYTDTIKVLVKTLLCVAIMFVSLKIVNLFISTDVTSRMDAIITIIIYGVIAVIVYAIVAFKSNLINTVFGDKFLSKIFGRFSKKLAK